jgi:hypothetical protein
MITIGVDAHKHEHVAVVLDEGGRELDRRRGPNSVEGWMKMLPHVWIRRTYALTSRTSGTGQTVCASRTASVVTNLFRNGSNVF